MTDIRPDVAGVSETLQQINRLWLDNRPQDLRPYLHPGIVMAYPGFQGRAEGRDTLIAGFVDFCDNAKIESYTESGQQIDLTGNTAVATLRFEMVYTRDGASWHSTGRDLWVFEWQGDRWLAVWRTMLDVAEEPAG